MSKTLQDIPGQDSIRQRISKGLSLWLDQEVTCRECVGWTLEKDDVTQSRPSSRVRIKFKSHLSLQSIDLPGAQQPVPSWDVIDVICRLITVSASQGVDRLNGMMFS